MASHAIDMIMLKNLFGTEEMREIWSDKNRIQKHLDVEAALAMAEGELGLIPQRAAEKIKNVSMVENFDIDMLANEVQKVKHSLMPTIKALEKLCGEDGEYVHFGVTTQDIVDTGTILQLKEAHQIIKRDLIEVIKEFARISKEYKSTPIVGRTHGMQALPTTFGFKMAVYLSESLRHLDRLNELESRIFTGNISGGVGTYASFGEMGMDVEVLTLNKLGLDSPDICWHSSRDRIAEYVSCLGLISGTLGKMGNEFYNLMRTEINEIEEPFSPGKIGSTTMPHKRNPAALEGLASLTKPIRYNVALAHDCLLVEHERDAMSWRGEWLALPESLIYLSSQLINAKAILKDLVVKPENMLLNLKHYNGLLVSERVMFHLSEKLGKQTAHHLVYEICMDSVKRNKSFKELLIENENVNEVLSLDKIEELLDEKTYIGSAELVVNRVLNTFDSYDL